MALTPQDIESITFSPSKHGYDTEEVDAFLEQVSGELDAMLQKIADLKNRLNSSEQQLAAAQAQVESLQASKAEAAAAAPVAEAPAPAQAPSPAVDTSASERQISQVLIIAQQSADKIVAEAQTNAEQIRNDADQKAREVIRQALAEKQNELDEIDRLKTSRDNFRSEYRMLLQRFMDEAEEAFATSSPSFSVPAAESESYMGTAEVAPAVPATSNVDDLD